jgi:hypothetical protein
MRVFPLNDNTRNDVEKVSDKAILVESRKLFYDYRKIKVFFGYSESDPNHFENRLKQRFPTLDMNYVKMLLRKALDRIYKNIENNKNDKYTILSYMIEDNHSNLKFPLEIEFNSNHEPIAVLTTVLDKSQHWINNKAEIELKINESVKGNYNKVYAFNDIGNNNFQIIFENGEKIELFDVILLSDIE